MTRRFFIAFAALTLMFGLSTDLKAQDADLENTIYMDLVHGRVVIKLLPSLAPKHVQRIKELTREGFYDGLTFHRVMEGFMAQGGDPTGTGRGGSRKPDLPAEFTHRAKFVRGVCGMARTSSPDTANSQFFIMLASRPGGWTQLDGQYTIWGQVVEGMDFVDKIKKAPAGSRSGTVTDPDIILKMQVAADAK